MRKKGTVKRSSTSRIRVTPNGKVRVKTRGNAKLRWR